MAVRILHLHSTFALGGKEARAVRLINAFGDSATHTIVSAMPGEISAKEQIERGIRADFPDRSELLNGLPGPRRMLRLARFMRGFDLVLTYNWGAFDAVMARRMFGAAMKLPPLVHHEDGFNHDEADQLKDRRNLYRRLGLAAAHRLVVPSDRLEAIARKSWGQSERRVERIPNGIPVARYAAPLVAGSAPWPDGPEGEIIVGTVAGLRPVKNLPRLVRAFAAMQMKNSRLVIVGQGPESEQIAAEARACGVADRLVMPGFLPDPSQYIGRFHIFALSSNSEQFPISLVEAMAAGLPAVATSVGDIFSMVSDDNRPLIVEPADEAAFAAALDTLAERPDLRRAIGRANREKAARDYDDRAMIARYASLYGEAIGDPNAFIAAAA